MNGAIDADGEIQNGGPEPKIDATVHSQCVVVSFQES